MCRITDISAWPSNVSYNHTSTSYNDIITYMDSICYYSATTNKDPTSYFAITINHYSRGNMSLFANGNVMLNISSSVYNTIFPNFNSCINCYLVKNNSSFFYIRILGNTGSSSDYRSQPSPRFCDSIRNPQPKWKVGNKANRIYKFCNINIFIDVFVTPNYLVSRKNILTQFCRFIKDAKYMFSCTFSSHYYGFTVPTTTY